jgi:hypothetical protein
MDYCTQKKIFIELVRVGWKYSPETLQSLISGEISAKDLAIGYCQVDESVGLTVEQATDVILKALENPEY